MPPKKSSWGASAYMVREVFEGNLSRRMRVLEALRTFIGYTKTSFVESRIVAGLWRRGVR